MRGRLFRLHLSIYSYLAYSISGVSEFSLSASQIFLSSAKVKTRGLEVGQSPCVPVHAVSEQLCGKHEVIAPDGTGDKHFEERSVFFPQSSSSCQGRDRKLQMEIDDGKVN